MDESVCAICGHKRACPKGCHSSGAGDCICWMTPDKLRAFGDEMLKNGEFYADDAATVDEYADVWEAQLRAVVEACHGEYMSCPLCSGHIGWQNTYHDEHCPLVSFSPEERIRGEFA